MAETRDRVPQSFDHNSTRDRNIKLTELKNKIARLVRELKNYHSETRRIELETELEDLNKERERLKKINIPYTGQMFSESDNKVQTIEEPKIPKNTAKDNQKKRRAELKELKQKINPKK